MLGWIVAAVAAIALLLGIHYGMAQTWGVAAIATAIVAVLVLVALWGLINYAVAEQDRRIDGDF